MFNSGISSGPVSGDLADGLQANISALKNRFKNSADVIYREFTLGFASNPKAVLIYIDGMINQETTSGTILKPLMFDFDGRDSKRSAGPNGAGDMADVIANRALPNKRVQKAKSLKDVVDGILCGNTALLIDGSAVALVIETKGWESRNVDEPGTESIVRGPREGFTENIGVNSAMLRRKIKDENLRIESLELGRRTKTLVYLAYIDGVARREMVNEVKRRLNKIEIDGVLESGYIEQLIEDAPRSIFPTVGNTEKPDVVAAKLLEGRLAIFVDGTPFVLTVPHLFVEGFQSSEDYYSRPYYATTVRLVRYLAFVIAVLLPAGYVALQSYSQDLLPTPLLISMVASREGTPFPSYMEVLIMGVIFEIMREAGVRMPGAIGQAFSIVGALVLGEASARAGLVSNSMIVVVALTAISGFALTSLADVIGLLRLFFIACAAPLGLFGILMGGLTVLIHMFKLYSFGVPYLLPIAPGNLNDLKDVFIRAPLGSQVFPPRILGHRNLARTTSDRRPPGKD
ncbi:Bacillus/Clostridium Ger spore germination protein [Acididesulfobacillus acetoxydans]|uniref:Bacillus/Clostridium Ger spore germination protein n=1 Tax=Acididesulfobacillus acetoxydans TaxID=1561005 RepID=A0A8S0WKW7_9FIRM|nr:spore germination protein [Acididesulfobacillus acetoxydans]CAA7599664.1 Bacillus/Clostridium Ger spore germination protein [Acididesulfobacillus acetoxydans]CEJ06216.1 Spore germination protein KA [Acididesulfobacillus acetoxydans]